MPALAKHVLIFLRTLAFGATALLVACAPLQPTPVIREVRVEVPVRVAMVEPVDLAAQALLRQHERLLKLSPAELAQEVLPRDDAALAPAAASELALALITSHGSGELARAQALLDQVQRSDTPEARAWQGLTRLLSARLTEQRRLEEQIDKLNQQARDNQRRLDQLNDKLEALKAIERSLNARPATAGGKP